MLKEYLCFNYGMQINKIFDASYLKVMTLKLPLQLYEQFFHL